MLLHVCVFYCIYIFLSAAACDCTVSLLEESQGKGLWAAPCSGGCDPRGDSLLGAKRCWAPRARGCIAQHRRFNLGKL